MSATAGPAGIVRTIEKVIGEFGVTPAGSNTLYLPRKNLPAKIR